MTRRLLDTVAWAWASLVAGAFAAFALMIVGALMAAVVLWLWGQIAQLLGDIT